MTFYERELRKIIGESIQMLPMWAEPAMCV